jgi:hypothetical protein
MRPAESLFPAEPFENGRSRKDTRNWKAYATGGGEGLSSGARVLVRFAEGYAGLYASRGIKMANLGFGMVRWS